MGFLNDLVGCGKLFTNLALFIFILIDSDDERDGGKFDVPLKEIGDKKANFDIFNEDQVFQNLKKDGGETSGINLGTLLYSLLNCVSERDVLQKTLS